MDEQLFKADSAPRSNEPRRMLTEAQVLEIVDDKGSTKDMGIEITGETRTLADERALGVLQQRLRAT